jgi:hypothetical protein
MAHPTCAHCQLLIWPDEGRTAGGTIHRRCADYWAKDPRNPANAPKPRARFGLKPFGLTIASDGMPETYGHESVPTSTTGA